MTGSHPTAEDRIRAATWFADRGFGVFSVWSADPDGTCRCPKGRACENAGKHPIGRQGFLEHTRDPERIRILLSAESEPNYGLVCPDGVFVLDVDGDGVARLIELEATLGPLPPTLRTNTAHGQHVFLCWPADHPRPIGQLFGYVTRWGSGNGAGYVIGPRSVHATGAVYAPASADVEIAILPETWVRAAIAKQPGDGAITVTGPRPASAITVGHRHGYLRDRARHLRGVGLSGEALFAAVMDLNRQLGEPKSPDEVRRAIGDVEEKFGPDAIDPQTGRPTVSAQRDRTAGRRKAREPEIIEGLAFYTAAQVAAMTPETVDWAWGDYLAHGTIVEIVGPPKAGKTTLVFGLIRAYLDGRPFLDRPTGGGPVVVLTEQGSTSLRAVLARCELTERDDLHVLFHRDTKGHEWPDVVTTAVAHCGARGARLLIVDTLPAFAGLVGESENHAGDALEAMEPLLAAADQGLAVLVNRHRRKSTPGAGAGDVADEGRGSGAFSGAVDVILSLRRKSGGGRPTIRTLVSASRFDDTPEQLNVELVDGRYVTLADDAALESDMARGLVLELLDEHATGMTLAELEEITGKSRTNLQRALNDLEKTHDVERHGRGVRGDPTRYQRCPEPPGRRRPARRLPLLRRPPVQALPVAHDRGVALLHLQPRGGTDRMTTATRSKTPVAGVHRTKTHQYYFNGAGPWPGVTSVTKVLDAPALTYWKMSQVAQAAIAGAERLIEDRQAGKVDAAVKYLTTLSTSAMDRGSRIHSNIESILRHEPFTPDPRDADAVAGARAWLNQQVREHGLRPLEVEAFLINETLGYGGTLDLIAELDGETWLLDWKTGKSVAWPDGRVYADHRLQLAAYANAGFIARIGDPERHPLPAVTRFGIVHVTDGGTRLYEADVTERDWIAFRACLNLWDWQRNGGKAA